MAFKNVPRITVRSRQQQYFPLEVGKGVENIVDYSSIFHNDEWCVRE